jgi:putative sigma-54 modulation protein
MKIDITGRQVDVTPALREFAEEKLAKLGKLLLEPIDVHVVLSITKHRHIAEIQVKSRTVVLAGTEETGDLYVSIGEVVDKLERQALKHKEKVRDHRKRPGPRDPKVAQAIGGEDAGEAERQASSVSPTGTPPRIVESQPCRVRPMSAEDAVMELEASQDQVLVYRDAQSERIRVLYRQKDGNYGLIDPES